MNSSTNMPLKASQRKEQQRLKVRRLAKLRSFIVLSIIVATALVDVIIFKSDFLITRGVALGSLINWLAQSLFSWFVFRYQSVQSKNAIVGQLFLGQIMKWMVVICGFGITLVFIKPIATGAVVFGFLAMQLGHFISLWKLSKY